MEVIVDRPKEAFVWDLKFWQPKGLLQAHIMVLFDTVACDLIAPIGM